MKIVIIVIVSVVVVLGALVGAGFVMARGGFARPPEVVKVRVEAAARGPLVEVVSVPGEIQPKTKVSISPRVSARIAELPHLEGATVKKLPAGTTRPSRESLLVRLDSKDLEAQLQSVEARADAQTAQIKVNELRILAQKAQIEASKATLADAERDMKRKRGLAETKDISQSEADTAQARFDELTAQLLGAQQTLLSEQQNLEVLRYQQVASQAEIAKAREELSYTVISSPIDGVITKLKAEVGEQVVPGIQGSVGSAILEVADLSQMLMVARVDEANIAAVKVGQRATVRIQAYRDRTFEGVVDSVALAKAEAGGGGRSSRSADVSANYYEAKILLRTGPGERIPTGLNADAEIETSRHEGLRVPSQAVVGRQVDALPADLRARPEVEREKSIASVVYRFVDGKAVTTPVKVGPSDETHTIVLSGLAAGDMVISGPFKALDTLTHDQVVAKEDGPPRAASATKPAASQPATRMTKSE